MIDGPISIEQVHAPSGLESLKDSFDKDHALDEELNAEVRENVEHSKPIDTQDFTNKTLEALNDARAKEASRFHRKG
jgi:hypothetical protein